MSPYRVLTQTRTISQVHPLFWPRCRAYARDAVGYFGVALATLPAGIWLNQAGIGSSRPAVIGLSFVSPLIAAAWAARAESTAARATWGKRAERLRVQTIDGDQATYPAALIRNLVKISLPWQIGHVVAIGASDGGLEDGDPLILAATAVIYPLIGIMVWLCARDSGRGLHDRLAGTVVTAEPASEQTPSLP